MRVLGMINVFSSDLDETVFQVIKRRSENQYNTCQNQDIQLEGWKQKSARNSTDKKEKDNRQSQPN